MAFLEENNYAPFAEALARVQAQHPLVDCITNIVTAGDVANGLLAIGASPVMASAPEEITYFMAKADALLLNLGATPEEQRRAMLLGAAEARRLGKPIVVDPVGIGTSPLRHAQLTALLRGAVAVIRGNISEISALAGHKTMAGGVDASASDAASLEASIIMARTLAQKYHTIIAISGETDIVTDGARTLLIHGGSPQMTRVTGTGCTLTGLVAAFVAASGDALVATAAAIGMMCLAGDRALAKVGPNATASFRTAMFDALSGIGPDDLRTNLSFEFIGGNHD